MTWQTLPTRKRGNAHGEMRLRIANAKNGRLNAAACRYLFDIRTDGARFILFARDDVTSVFGILATAGPTDRPPREGIPVSTRGNVTVSSLTSEIPGAKYPVTIMLKAGELGHHHLVFAGWQP